MKIVKLTNDTKQNLLETLLKRSTNDYGDYEKVVAEIIEAVKERKEEAVFEYSLKFDKCTITRENLPQTLMLSNSVIYDILYILLFWGIYCNKFPLNQQTSNLCEQQLLEITTQNLYNWHYEWSDFINIWSSFISCPAAQFICTTGIDLGYNSFTENEKFKAKTLGLSLCLYDMAIKKRKEPSASLRLFLNDNYYTAQVDALRISSDNINSYLHSLWEDNRL